MAWCNGRINGAHWQPIEDIRAGAPCLRCAEEDLADRVESAERAVIEAVVAYRSVPRAKSLNDLLAEICAAGDALIAARIGGK